MRRPVILILMGGYWPGHEATGPNTSIRALCLGLEDHFDFRMVARDRGFGDAVPLVASNGWSDLGFARIHYLRPGSAGARGLAALMRQTPYDALVLNGFFDRDFTIPALLARRLGTAPRKPTLLSPRGEFSGGALGLKAGRKAMYRAFVERLGLLRGVTLHVTSEGEEADVAAALPRLPRRRVANFRPLPPLLEFEPTQAGMPLRVAFVGRLSPVKGLDHALEMLALVRSPTRFEIYGPIGDADHWRRCQALITKLPAHITVEAYGAIPNDAVSAMLARQDLMLLPSLSENFGHAIFEALAAGTPTVIGDQTPWRGLEARKAGFDLPLGEKQRFADALDRFAEMDASERNVWRRGARSVAEAHVVSSTAAAEMRSLLSEMVER